MIRIANTQLELALPRRILEEQYNAQYLVNEYEGMLEENKGVLQHQVKSLRS